MKQTSQDLTTLTTSILAGRAFLIKTAACIWLFTHLKRWLTTGILGAIVYGRPRLGKTSGCRWVLRTLTDTLGTIPWVEIPIRKSTRIDEGAFFQFLLVCCGHKLAHKGRVSDKRDRLHEALLRKARRSPTRTIILFIDEAQLLTEEQYYWLHNISNELDMQGCRVFFLLVGQHQLIHRKETFMLLGYEEIVGRFMTEDVSFPGVESLDQIQECLQGYDVTIYPQDSGQYFPSLYVPLAYDAGWRLEHIAEPLWEQFKSSWVKAGRIGNPIIPMSYLSSSVTNLLNDLAKRDKPSLVVADEFISRAVFHSGFASAVAVLRSRDMDEDEDNGQRSIKKK